MYYFNAVRKGTWTVEARHVGYLAAAHEVFIADSLVNLEDFALELAP